MVSGQHDIIAAGPEWATRYREFSQLCFQAAYTRPDLGLTADLFSADVFRLPGLVAYYADAVCSDAAHATWPAVNAAGDIDGGVTAAIDGDGCELKNFYVRPDSKVKALAASFLTLPGSLPPDVPSPSKWCIFRKPRWRCTGAGDLSPT